MVGVDVVVDLNVIPECLGLGPVYVGGLLLVTKPVLMGLCLDLEVGSDVSRGGGSRRNADSELLER